MPLFLLHTIILIGGGIFQLVKRYRKSSGKERIQYRLLLVGTALMFTAIIITNLLFVVVFNNSSLINQLPVYTLVFVGFVTYAIIRHRMLDISFVVARTVAFTILVFLVSSLYALGLFTLAEIFPNQYYNAISIGLSLVLAITFNPLRLFLQNITDKILHQRGYKSEELLENLGDDVRSTLSLEDIAHRVGRDLSSTLHATNTALLLISMDTTDVRIINQGFDTPPNLTKDQVVKLATKAKHSLIVYEEETSKINRELMRSNNISVIVPLRVSNSIHGIFVLGEKSSGDIYNTQDLNVLEIIGPQISIAIQNSLAYDQIRRFNITLRQKIKAATTDLRKANRELRHLDKLKDEFVFIATHELKTPVTVMKGYLSMIDDGSYGKLPEKIQEPFKEIVAANAQLIQLVNDLLEIARAEAKTLTINTQPVDIVETVDHTISSLKTLSDQKELKVTHNKPANSLWVMADKDKLREITNNLLSNAIKYSQNGTIILSHVVEKDLVVTHVADQGVGIAKEDQEHIFTRFFRADEQAGKVPGTGLGLFIVKQLVEKMKGRIWFTSQPGKGTTFSFSLPQTKPPKDK